MGAEQILIIEDDTEIQEMLKYAFTRDGWTLIQVTTGEEGLKALQAKRVDCVILDIMLPGMDGIKTLKKIREEKKFQRLPVILCTARGEEADVVAGLELGADDYVVKPYSPRVLAARIRAGLRRNELTALEGEDSSKTFWQHGKLIIDVEKHAAFLDDKPLDLFATEFAILACFMSHPDIVFSRQKLITAVRGGDYPVTDRSVDVQIMGLRKKLGEAGNMIETIRSVGYRFRTEIND
ncbi:MAG: response regulator transcription factor [Treponema sp.]|nr:response regulator transcription factor [Treponema sp.]